MFSVEIDYLVRQEQYKELQREVARQQLIQIAKLRRASNPDKTSIYAIKVGYGLTTTIPTACIDRR